jgi:hypothetical protein
MLYYRKMQCNATGMILSRNNGTMYGTHIYIVCSVGSFHRCKSHLPAELQIGIVHRYSKFQKLSLASLRPFDNISPLLLVVILCARPPLVRGILLSNIRAPTIMAIDSAPLILPYSFASRSPSISTGEKHCSRSPFGSVTSYRRLPVVEIFPPSSPRPFYVGTNALIARSKYEERMM